MEKEDLEEQLTHVRENLSDVNKELQAALRSEREKVAIISAMSNIYYCSYMLDFVSGKVTEISSVEYLREYFSVNASLDVFFDSWKNELLDEHFKEDMENFIDLATLSERMKDTQILNFDCISKKSGWIRVSFIAVCRNEEDDLLRVLWVAQHIDAEKQKELAQQKALKVAYDAANRANSAKTDFLAHMSHDIRTPMNAIIGMTAIASAHLDDKERVADCLNKITISSKHLLGLINEILDMSKIESGKVDLHDEEFSLPDLIDNLLVMVKPQIKAKNHHLTVSIQKIEHEMVIGDSQRIQQSFINLMSNAVKYTPAGGNINLTISEKPTNKPNLGCYEFIFEDNGIGMSKEFLSKLFDPFARANDSRVEKIEGTGLGMAITYNMVQMMNGSIKAESELNKGTKITVNIIMKLQENQQVVYEKNETSLNTIVCNDFQGKRALLVEDNELNAEIAGEILEMAGFEVEYAENGQKALDIMTTAEDGYYDIVFMDIQMPIMNGYDATIAIRALSRGYTKGVPIVAMTANAFAEDIQASKNAGMNEHIAKPLDFKQLVKILHKWLD